MPAPGLIAEEGAADAVPGIGVLLEGEPGLQDGGDGVDHPVGVDGPTSLVGLPATDLGRDEPAAKRLCMPLLRERPLAQRAIDTPPAQIAPGWRGLGGTDG